MGLGLAGIALAWLVETVHGGDTGPLLSGTEALGRCLADLDVVACDDPTPVGPYPVLQYVPDLAADAGAELSQAGRRRVLATLSLAGVVAALAAAWVVLRRVGLPEWRWAILATVASGPVLAYGGSTWGEMLALGLLTLLAAAALLPAHPGLVALAAFGASLTKETGYPFVVALGLVALLLARRRTGRPIRRHLLLGGAGIVLALAASSAFNLLRFGTPRNAHYLDPALRTASPEKVVELAVGLLVAPNGGIVLFWPLASLLVVAGLAACVLRVVRGAASWREGGPAFALAGTVLALTIGLATWWSPFGWWAWGPRLALPWVLPLLLLAVVAGGSLLAPAVARLLRPTPAFVAVAMLAVLVALPHVGFLWDADGVLTRFFLRETALCPGGGPPPTPVYYDCLGEQMWTRHPIWLDALAGLRTTGGAATTAAVAATVVGSLVLFRRELRERLGAV